MITSRSTENFWTTVKNILASRRTEPFYLNPVTCPDSWTTLAGIKFSSTAQNELSIRCRITMINGKKDIVVESSLAIPVIFGDIESEVQKLSLTELWTALSYKAYRPLLPPVPQAPEKTITEQLTGKRVKAEITPDKQLKTIEWQWTEELLTTAKAATDPVKKDELWWQKADRQAQEQKAAIVQLHADIRHFLFGE